jgi:hypothetical protein
MLFRSMYHMLCFMLLTLLSACSKQSTTCIVTSIPCHLPVNLNCLFIHLSRLRFSRSNNTTPHSFLLVLVPSAIVPSVPLHAYPFTPPSLFTCSYILTCSTCLSLSFNITCCCPLSDLNLLVPSLLPHYTQSTYTIFLASSTYICFRVYRYPPHVSLYLPVLFLCLFLVLYCNHSFIYVILVPCSVYTRLYTISVLLIPVGSVLTTTEL